MSHDLIRCLGVLGGCVLGNFIVAYFGCGSFKQALDRSVFQAVALMAYWICVNRT